MLAALMGSVYWGAAVFFSILFLWQLLATLFGHIGGGEHVEVSGGGHDLAAGGHDAVSGHDGAVGAAESVASFKLLSIRSITAFGMLFGWAGVLYSRQESPPAGNLVIAYSLVWGFVGMLIVSAIFYFLMRMTETGTRRLVTCVGQRGLVYMDIPAGGTGQVKTIVSGTVSFVPARAVGGEALKAGTPVIVKRLLDSTTVEVEKAEQ
jgi:hypothetical protein